MLYGKQVFFGHYYVDNWSDFARDAESYKNDITMTKWYIYNKKAVL